MCSSKFLIYKTHLTLCFIFSTLFIFVLASETSIIKDKMEHVGSSFTEFFEKVNKALRGLESANDEIYAILESNAFLSDNLPKIESRLRDGESTREIVNELTKDVKPRAEKLRKALEQIQKKVPNFLFLDLPSQRHGLSVGNLAADNISRFDNLLNEVSFRTLDVWQSLSENIIESSSI